MPFVPDGQQPTPATAAPPAAATSSVVPLAAASAPAQGGHFVPDPTPSWRDSAWAQDAAALSALGARTGIRVLSAFPNLAASLAQSGPGLLSASADQVAAETGGNYAGDDQKKVMPAVKPMWEPSEAIIKGIGDLRGAPLALSPDASPAMKAADFALPFFGSGLGSAIGRINEAAGPLNKTAEGLGFLGGASTDAALSYLGSALGQEYGGDQGGFAGSLLFGSARPVAQRMFGWGGQKTMGSPEGGEIFDAMTNPAGPNVMPTWGQVTDNTGKQLEKSVQAVPILRSGVQAQRDRAEAGIQNSVATGIGEVGNRAPNPAPVAPEVTGGRIIDLSRQANTSQKAALSAEQDALERAINPDRPTGVSPLVETLSGMANAGPGPITRVVAPRTTDLYNSLNAGAEDAGDLTAPYGHLKILRTDLGEKTKTTDPIKGPAYDTAYGAYTDAMRGGAEAAGQGPQFDQANLDYHTFKKVNQPWLKEQGGDPEGPRPSPHTLTSDVTGITGAGSDYLNDIRTKLGLDPARATLADVLSRLGQVKGKFAPSQWGRDWGGVSPTVQQFVAQHSPGAASYLNNAAIGGKAFDLAPERPGASNAAGFLGSLAAFLANAPKTAIATAGALETPSVIRAMAGRTDIPALLAQYAIRQGAAQQERGARP